MGRQMVIWEVTCYWLGEGAQNILTVNQMVKTSLGQSGQQCMSSAPRRALLAKQ